MTEPMSCPHCGHDAFDGQGEFRRQYRQLRTNAETLVYEVWYQHGCTECGTTFAIRERIAEAEVDDV